VKSLLITGLNGLLGNRLLHAAGGRFRIAGLDLRPEPLDRSVLMEYAQADILDQERVLGLMRRISPDAVIHTAAFTEVDACESQFDQARAVNVLGAANVATACRETGAKLVHLSTDYVFDGGRGPYSEDDVPNPISAYGRMKLESEATVVSLLPDAVVARTMVLFGRAPLVRNNFVTWLVDALQNGKRVRIVKDQSGTPTFADDLALAILALIDGGQSGLYHAAGPDCLSRHAFALLIAEVFRLDRSLIDETTSESLNQPAPRPKRSGLTAGKLLRDTGFQFKPLREALEQLKRQTMTRPE
jgi:dTDP-4-dehydrorhamnose reductase